MNRPLSILLLAAFVVSTAPIAGADWGNHHNVAVGGVGTAASSCQILIFVQAVAYLSVEDGLGLAAARTNADLADVLPEPTVSTANASCEVVIDSLEIPHTRGSLVTGGTVASPSRSLIAPPVLAPTAAASVSICSVVVFVDSVLVGGTAFGLPAGRITHPIEVSSSNAISHATCSVRSPLFDS